MHTQHQTHPPTPERLHGLDALRGLALLLGVALHLSMSYLPGAEYFWIVSDGEHSSVLAGLFYLIHLFRMPLFFLLAGYFGRLGLQRLGVAEFARDRFSRIVVPLLSAWPLVFTGIIVAVVWVAWLQGGGQLPAQSPPGPKFTPDDFPLTHLWFLYVLTLYYIGMLVLRGVVMTVDRQGRLLRLADAGMRLLLGPWAPLLLALPLAACLATQDGWYAWFGVPTPDQSLYPNLPAQVGFGVAFGFGWLLQRQPVLLTRIAGRGLMNLTLALIGIVICLYIVGIDPLLVPAAPDDEKLVYALAYASASWALTLALLGLALRHLNGHSATRRYLADASYWIYLVHLPIVMLLQVAMFRLDWPWWIEYPLALMLGMALMLASYEWLVRYSWIGARLNGKRRQRTPTATCVAAGNPAATAMGPESAA